MLSHETEFPAVGSTGYLAGTAKPARILQRCGDGTFLVERRQRVPGGGTAPIPGAAGNRRVEEGELFATLDAAMFGNASAARRARRSRYAGGR